ncbi:MAG: hypothetical protein P8M30_17675 [Planctomycetaceae bacterium]|jgi:hypothetical protein|nr:hypothetical protein [bacterium]MDG2391141.1 hypothetical protein [Planctomycetaceae bacterium]
MTFSLRKIAAFMVICCLSAIAWSDIRPLPANITAFDKNPPLIQSPLRASDDFPIRGRITNTPVPAMSFLDEVLTVDALENCIFMTQQHRPADKAARLKLKPDHTYSISVRGEAFLSGHTKSAADPFPGVTLFYCTNEEDGYATKMKILKPGDVLNFQTPRKKSEHNFLSAFFIDYWPESQNRGSYELILQAEPVKRIVRGKPSADAHRILNVNFGKNPDDLMFDGIVGGPHDIWTLVDVGEQVKTAMPFADGSVSDVKLELSENDGEWGITDHVGVYHAYLYHNCRCVDLSLKMSYLPAGAYEVYVFAHGDAPDQNAAIEIQSAGTTYSGKSTLNDGSYRYRSHDYESGNQYVKYTIVVEPDSPVVITSKRAGSEYSMLNAIQFKRLEQ